MKKFFSTFLLACIILSLFSACAKPQVPDIEESESELDFHGGKVVVYMDLYNNLFKPVAGATAADDRMNQRLYDIQNKYNLVFAEEVTDNPALTFMTGSLTGNFTADIVIDGPAELYEIYKIDSLVPTEEIIENPKDNKYGTPKLIEAAIFHGKQYGVLPYLHDTPPDIAGLLSLKMDYVKEFNLNDPHEIIEAGEWDWEHFRQYLTEATFSDGDIDYAGMVLSGRRNSCNSFAPFILSNGGSMIKYSEAGGYQVAFNSPEAIEAMEYISSVFSSPYADCPAVDEKKYIITLGSPSFKATEDEIHVLRVPYGPKGSPDTISSIFYDFNFWAYPIFTIYAANELSAITNDLFEPLSDIYPNGWKDYVMDNYFYDTQDYEYYCIAADNALYIDNDLFGNTFFPLLQRINSGTDSVQASIESLTDLVQSRLDEKYNH